MKSYFLYFSLLLAGLFLLAGCNNSSGEAPVKTGTASFQIKWPDEADNKGVSVASAGTVKLKSLATNEHAALQDYLSDECEARGVATVEVTVRDNHNSVLASGSFACELGEGIVENISVGANRRFIVYALDQNGDARYYGERTGITIETGDNDVGVIEMAEMTTPPVAVIDAPADNSLFATGSEITFSGSASDAQDGSLSGDALVWNSDIDGRFGTGTAVSATDLSQGNHTITLTATDSDGDYDSASILITLNDPPFVAIDSPEDNAIYGEETEMLFSGSATDTEDGELSGDLLVWTSSIDDQIGLGSSFSTSSLSIGTHTITLTAKDSDGATGSASITLTINDGPVALIEEPLNNAVFTTGSEVIFTGSATDAEDGELSGDALVWTSSLDEQIGTGTGFSLSDLSAGTHTITLTATDSGGMTGRASIALTINSPPTAAITQPYEGSLHAGNDNIYFEGSATDPEDGLIASPSALAWTSDIDGTIGSGESFVTKGLTSGLHSITLVATDSNGATGSDSLSIQVIAQKLPDTGQTVSYTTTFGEDADYTNNPPSYTKLDESARDLDPTANTWAMVRDNVTGLIWEVKTTDGTIHDVERTYSYSDAKAIFIENLNGAAFGGYTDWRLPTIMEFYTIVSGAYTNLAMNQNYFPNRPDSTEPWYWSDTLEYGSTDRPWVIDFASGKAVGYEGTIYYVRAVRGPQLNFGRFVDNGDGTITDTSTGLMWQKTPNSGELDWETALVFCEEELYGFAGYTDWRVPNRHELHTLVDYTREDPAIDPAYFDHPSYSSYWTSTTDPGNAGSAYSLSFFSGFGYYKIKGDFYTIVRAVRGGQ